VGINKLNVSTKSKNVDIGVSRNLLDCIYDQSQLGFERLISSHVKTVQPQDPLEEINLKEETNKRPTLSTNLLSVEMRESLIEFLR